LDYKTTAIILKSSRLGESDKILHLYSPEHGPLRVVAKSAYKLNSKVSAKSQVLNICEWQLATGRNLDLVKEAKLLESFRGINSSYEALALACFWVDIVDQVAVSDEHYMEPYGLLIAALIELNQTATIDHKLEDLLRLSVKFLWDLISALGYKPEIYTCSVTGKKRSAEQVAQYFDFENGSITSSSAYLDLLEVNPYLDNIEPLQPSVFRVLESLTERTWFEMQMPYEGLKSSLIFLKRHLAYCLHKEFRSWTLVQELLSAPLQEINSPTLKFLV
jgi:DNA repair protein RecO